MSKEREFIRLWYENIELWKVHAKELLAQPETKQEPVAWMSINNNGGISIDSYYANHKDYVPLYTAPPKREPLSDGAICQILLKKEWRGFVDLVRIIEKAHGIGVDDESI